MKKLILFSSIFIFALFFSCKKNQLGGKATIKGKVVHHSKIIPLATVYIKYNATEFPGRDSSVYDSKVSADQNGEFTLKTYKGDYYLYATGLDHDPDAFYVSGGAPVKMHKKETVQIEVPVTENH